MFRCRDFFWSVDLHTCFQDKKKALQGVLTRLNEYE